ncbi:MAG: trypsin-like peptidase domain-containing protein [Rhodospirillaceae bacterium]|nr:trypsin-like peptidase domain-containing protein [Rhodospirillaceae bacterium]
MRHRHNGGWVGAALLWLALAIGSGWSASPAAAFDAKRADQSVVRVVVFEIKNGKRTGTYSFGTGFVVAPEYVVTNEHVTDDSDFRKNGGSSERVVVDGSKKNLRPAQLVWSSPELDLAVVRVPGLARPPLTLSSAPPYDYPGKGDAVWALGFPGIADRSIQSEQAFVTSTLTQGVVGKVVEGRAGGRDKARPVIQHNASINKGNSGGPLFDNCGTVVGVNTFGAVSTMEVRRDNRGNDVAAGMPNTGIFYSPHISNFIAAQKTVAALAPIRLTVTAGPCSNAAPPAEPAGLPIWVYGAIGFVTLLALTSTVVAFRKGTTREIVRVVESYSAYIRRQGAPPSILNRKAARSAARPKTAAAAPSAPTGAWALKGRGEGAGFELHITADELRQGAEGSEGGVVLGRSRSLTDKVLDDPSVSRRHAKLFLAEGGLMVEDMGSAYGTKVNGKALAAFTAAPLRAGDTLGLGGLTLDVTAG